MLTDKNNKETKQSNITKQNFNLFRVFDRVNIELFFKKNTKIYFLRLSFNNSFRRRWFSVSISISLSFAPVRPRSFFVFRPTWPKRLKAMK